MRESFEKQIEIIEKYLGIKKEIKSDYSGWGDLNEIFERRNLFAHANGVVNKIYISKVPGSKYEIGDFLEVSSKYFSQSIQNLFEFGVKLIFVSWRRICANDLENIDDDLGNFCYAMMEGRQYSLAAKLLEFSLNQASPQTDKRRKMNIINLANCYRLAGDEEKSIQALEVVDWSASGDEFQICVASIRGDLEAVLRMMRTISQDKVEPSFYENWPVFYKVRDSEAFGDTFSEVFGRKYVPAAEDRHSFMELMSLVQEDAVNDKSPAAISEPLAEDHKALNGPKRPIRRRLLNVPAKGGGFK